MAARLLRHARHASLADVPGPAVLGGDRRAGGRACSSTGRCSASCAPRARPRSSCRCSACSSRSRTWCSCGSARTPKANAIGIVPHGSNTFSPLHNVFVSRDDLAIAITGAVVFLVLTLMLRYTAIGLRMRAVVESPRLTELAGVNSDRVSMSSWMLSSFIAGLAGVLLTPVFAGQVGYQAYEALVIAAIAAAVLGGLGEHPARVRGRPRCSASSSSCCTSTCRRTTSSPARFKPALPFVVAVRGARALARDRAPPLAHRSALRRRPAAARARARAIAARASRSMTRDLRGRVLRGRGVLAVLPREPARGSTSRCGRRSSSIIFLSITVITGFAGQISLCQATFAAIGAAATAQLVDPASGMSVIGAMFIGALIAGASSVRCSRSRCCASAASSSRWRRSRSRSSSTR